jgi:hypothetical protein
MEDPVKVFPQLAMSFSKARFPDFTQAAESTLRGGSSEQLLLITDQGLEIKAEVESLSYSGEYLIIEIQPHSN